MKKILLLTFMVMALSGCSVLKSPFALFKMHKPQQEQKYDMHEIMKREPKVVRIDKDLFGRQYAYIGDAITHEITTTYSQYNKKLSLWQRFMNLGKKGIIIGCLLAFLAFVFPPVAMVLGISGKALGFGTKTIVRGMEKVLDSMDPEARQKAEGILSQTYDAKTKALVSKIKHNGKK